MVASRISAAVTGAGAMAGRAVAHPAAKPMPIVAQAAAEEGPARPWTAATREAGRVAGARGRGDGGQSTGWELRLPGRRHR